MQKINKCHNCNGKGKVNSTTIISDCYYCRGKGIRNSNYGRDEK